jgi:hypothetical protein
LVIIVVRTAQVVRLAHVSNTGQKLTWSLAIVLIVLAREE